MSASTSSAPVFGDAVGWTEVRVLAPLGWHELVAEVLAPGPTASVCFGRPGFGNPAPPAGFEWVCTYLADEADTPQARERIRAELAGLAQAGGAAELAGLEPSFERLPAEDYAASWRASWRPFRVGRLCVVPPWSDAPLRERDLRLVLEPGGAFGSGRHATTRACLRVLQARLEPGARVLDAGSGSGILSVAAALLGASRALGFDVDPTALRYAEALARDNGVAQRCEFRSGGFELLEEAHAPFDAALANLYSDVIQGSAAQLAQSLKPGGWFVFSGCPPRERDATRRAIEAAGLRVEEEPTRGRWHTFAGRRPATNP